MPLSSPIRDYEINHELIVDNMLCLVDLVTTHQTDRHHDHLHMCLVAMT